MAPISPVNDFPNQMPMPPLDGVEHRQIEVVPGVGHFVAEERPDVVLAEARRLFGAPA